MSAPNNERMPSKVTRERLEVKACDPSEVSYEGTRERLEVKACDPSEVSYEGTREQLLEAGVAIPAMFPDPPATRRWSRNNSDRQGIVADRFAVTKKPEDQWRVTREKDWHDPIGVLRRKAADEAERNRYWAEQQKESSVPEDTVKQTFIDFIDSATEDMEEAARLADPEIAVDIRPIQALFDSKDETSMARCRALQSLVNIWACPAVNTDIWAPS